MAHLDAQNVVTRRKQRQVWPDSVKGICIALVVLLHVVSKHYASLDWPMPSVLAIGWEGISSVMEPIRMPLFFAISGYFSATYLAKPWGYVARKRLIPIFILYVLWLMRTHRATAGRLALTGLCYAGFAVGVFIVA